MRSFAFILILGLMIAGLNQMRNAKEAEQVVMPPVAPVATP